MLRGRYLIKKTDPAPSRTLHIPEEAFAVEGLTATASNRLTHSSDDVIALRANWRAISVVVVETAAVMNQLQPIHSLDQRMSIGGLNLHFLSSDCSGDIDLYVSGVLVSP